MRLPHLKIFLLTLALLAVVHSVAVADEAADIQARIDQRASDIKALEKEIAGYQTQLNTLAGQKSTLTAAIQALTITEKKLKADIAVTNEKIDATTLRIKQLSSEIGTTQETIDDNTRVIFASFRAMNEEGQHSTIEILLSSRSLGQAVDGISQLAVLEGNIRDKITELAAAKTNLEGRKKSTETAKADLLKLQKQIQDQRAVVVANQSEKNALLKQTKNSEAAYAKLLTDKQALKESFEKEVLQYESELKLVVDKGKLPSAGTSVLSWPMDNIYITQYFGNTPFATANPQIYNGSGHGGIDMRASVGTPIKAARSGTIVGVANTDIIRGCYSFGKWVMVRHDNGLSTLYAHLSVQSVSVGQTVTTGQVIGYSGNTGYSTGPHLHFSVYATDGVEIKLFTSSKNCKGATIPLAVLSAYLNPLSYLPKL